MLVNEHGERVCKVLVAVPSGEFVHADFARSLALLMSYTTYVKPDMEVLLYHMKGTYLPRARAGLVQEALDRSCTHVLFLDADMVFPKDTLLRLLAHERPIVAANYPTRQAPILPTAVDLDRQPMFAVEGLAEARSCGMGVMLVEASVFHAIGKPWFAIGYSKAADDYSGEDTFFCERARACQYQVWIDGPLSEQVEHAGGFRYGMAHARMTLEAATAVEV